MFEENNVIDYGIIVHLPSFPLQEHQEKWFNKSFFKNIWAYIGLGRMILNVKEGFESIPLNTASH
jgi:hypothetical protein